MPSTPQDAKGLLKSAIRDDNPVIFMENEVLYNFKGEVPEEEYHIPLGLGDVKRAGKDVTIVAWSRSVRDVAAAAELLAKDGIEAEVVDPRTLRPLDDELIFESVRKTNRCVVVEEGWRYAGFGAEIADRVQRECFDELDAPVLRVTAADVPMPYAKTLEKAYLPQPEKVVEAVSTRCSTDDHQGACSPSCRRRWRRAPSSSGARTRATRSRWATCWPRSRPTRPTWRWRRSARACCARSWCPRAARRRWAR